MNGLQFCKPKMSVRHAYANYKIEACTFFLLLRWSEPIDLPGLI